MFNGFFLEHNIFSFSLESKEIQEYEDYLSMPFVQFICRLIYASCEKWIFIVLLIVTDKWIKRGNFYLFWKENARIDEIAINIMTIVI